MRIGFLLLDGAVAGGQVVARRLMLAARARGHEPLALSPEPGPMVERLAADGIPCALVPLDRSYRLDQAARLALTLRRRRVDVLATHTLFVGNQLARAAAVLAGVPLVAHVHAHEWFHPNPIVAAVQRAAEARSARACAAVVAVSRHVRERLVRNGYPPAGVVVVPNGVDLPEPAPPPPAATGGLLRVACIARLAPSKGQETLLEALPLAGPGVDVSFAGDDLERRGVYREELERHARSLGVQERVRFLGHRPDVARLIDGSDVVVLPSLLEGLPVVVLEAMAHGRPVVATAVGGTPELVVHGETGLLVRPRDPRQLAAALARLRDDPVLRGRLGEAGRARAERQFALERMVERTLAVYEGLVPRRSPISRR